jgi:hypothetical protein
MPTKTAVTPVSVEISSMPLAPLVSLYFQDFLLFLFSMTIIEPFGNALK